MKPIPRSLRHAVISLAAASILGPPWAMAQPPADQAQAVPTGTASALAGRRLIVRYHDGLAISPASAAPRAVRRMLADAMHRAGGASRSASAGQVRRIRQLGTGAELLQLPVALADSEMQRLVGEIGADPAVRYAEPDTLQQIAAVPPPAVHPNDPYYASHQWHLHDPLGGVDAPAAWAISRGEGVVVAVIDTGILPGHPDFDSAHLLPGYDFISHPFISRRPDAGPAPGAVDLGDWSPVADECGPDSGARPSSWHGTHVAGTVAEATDNGVGVAGLAPGATILPVRVLGRCGGLASDIIDGITWASGGSVPGVPDNPVPAQVLNLSLGGGGTCSRAYQEAIDAAVARGAVVVVAAGNSAVDAGHFQPAGCRNVISVGATGARGAIAGYSNFGSVVDLAAPGGDGDGGNRGFVWQAGHSGATDPASGAYQYSPQTGTSMAAPHVAATAALVQSARVASGRLPLSHARMETLLAGSARPFPLAPPSATPLGRGILDAAAALRTALADDCDVAHSDCVAPLTLRTKVPAGAQAGDAVGRRATFLAAAGRPLRVLTYGGKGELTLYVRRATAPTPDAFDARSARAGTHESVFIAAPAADLYHVWLAGAPGFEGVTVVVHQ